MIERLPITDRLTWLEWRKPLLTASEIGAAAGVDQYMAPLELYLVKAGLRAPPEETALMRRGRLMEATAIEYLREELPGWGLLKPGVFLRDAERRIGATPDLLLTDPELPEQLINCQIKVVGAPAFALWPVRSDGKVEPPVAYRLQTAMESMLLDAHSGVLAVLVVNAFTAQLKTFPVARNAEAEAKILRIAADFWERIDRGVMPDPDFRRESDIVREMYPPDKAIEVPLDLAGDNRIGTLLEGYERANAAIRAATADKEAIKGEIIAKLKGATLAMTDGWKITYKHKYRTAYTVEAAEWDELRTYRTKEAA